jgi:hypothetical protein
MSVKTLRQMREAQARRQSVWLVAIFYAAMVYVVPMAFWTMAAKAGLFKFMAWGLVPRK